MTARPRQACRGEDPELFFPISYKSPLGLAQTEEAKAICRRCPSRRDCLEQRLAEEGNADVKRRHGIWGATTPADRRAIYDNRRRTALAA